MKTLLAVLKSADVPWSNTICQLAQNGVQEQHPLSVEIKKLEENTAVKLLVKKYDIEDVTDFDNEDVSTYVKEVNLYNCEVIFLAGVYYEKNPSSFKTRNV